MSGWTLGIQLNTTIKYNIGYFQFELNLGTKCQWLSYQNDHKFQLTEKAKWSDKCFIFPEEVVLGR